MKFPAFCARIYVIDWKIALVPPNWKIALVSKIQWFMRRCPHALYYFLKILIRPCGFVRYSNKIWLILSLVIILIDIRPNFIVVWILSNLDCFKVHRRLLSYCFLLPCCHHLLGCCCWWRKLPHQVNCWFFCLLLSVRWTITRNL